MSDKANGPPPGQPWIWLTRELLASDAWRSMTGKARKVIDFLLLEHMGHGGRANGKLKAPHRQLCSFGIGRAFTAPAILECERLGLIERHPGGARVATTYTLTWMPSHDGAPASNRWRDHASEKQKSVHQTVDRPTSQTVDRSPKSVHHPVDRKRRKPTSQTVYASKKSSYHDGEPSTEPSTDEQPAPHLHVVRP